MRKGHGTEPLNNLASPHEGQSEAVDQNRPAFQDRT